MALWLVYLKTIRKPILNIRIGDFSHRRILLKIVSLVNDIVLIRENEKSIKKKHREREREREKQRERERERVTSKCWNN